MTDGEGTQEINALFVGLPKTGKTSYLALAFAAISDVGTSGIDLNAHGEDLTYLNRVAGELEEYRQAAHTEVGGTESLSLSLRFSNQLDARVDVPDLSGETWLGVHLDRVWERGLVTTIPDCAGVALFANVDDHTAVQTVTELKADAEALGDTTWDESAPHTRDVPSAPSQMVLVDLLHALRRERPGTFRVSVVLSAYDAAEPADITPQAWVEANMPLLAQYLEVNADAVESRVFGVSAQGGAYPPSAEHLATPLLQRAYVRREGGEDAALLAPLLWALGHDDAD